MNTSKKLAGEMADAINLDGSFWRGYMQGFLNVPVDFYYLGKDMLDTDNNWRNKMEKERLIRMIKHGMASRRHVEQIIKLFLDQFFERVEFQQVKNHALKLSGNIAGKATFTQLTASNMGALFSRRIIPSYFAGLTVGSVLSAGAVMSRAVYESRELQRRNPGMYNHLRRLGDLDLIYFIVAEKTRPFEDAVALWYKSRDLFHETCHYFFEKVRV